MLKIAIASLFLALFCGADPLSAATGRISDDQFIGTWMGMWQGDGSGKFEMTIVKDQAGKLSGKITAMPEEGGSYSADFKSVVVNGNKATFKYDSPESDQLEITLEATLEGAAAKGAWKVAEKSGNNQVASGTWTATKKQP